MADEKDPRPAAEPDDPTSEDDDVEGHMFRQSAQVEADDPADDDVEGHAFYRSPASRGE